MIEVVDNPQKSNEFKKDVHLSDKINTWCEAFMHILLEHYKEYLVHGLIEPPQIKNATQRYKTDVDDVQEFIDTYIEPSTEIESTNEIEPSTENVSYVALKEIWSLYKKSEFHNKSMNMKTLRSLLIKKLGVDCPTKKKIKRVERRSPFVGYKFVNIGSEINQILANEV